MINQQLLDFIKQQLQSNSPKEKITSDLLTNGWTREDIEEGFGILKIQTPSSIPSLANTFIPPSYNKINLSPTTPSQPKTHSGRKIFFIILILFLLAGGASAYYFKNNLINLPIILPIFIK